LKTRVQQSSSASLSVALKSILAGPSPIQQLWRGTTPSVIRTGAGSALYFGMLNQLRRATSTTTLGSDGKTKTNLSNTANLATGAAARALAGFVMSPVTVLKVRYESSLYAYTSLSSAAKDIFKTNGAKGFFAGFGATAVRDAPYAGLYVLFYEQSKASLFGHLDIAAPIANFGSGVLAAAAATAVTNPFDAVKTRLQLQPEKYRNAVSAAKKMITEEGAMCLFDGLGIRMARKAISSALAWTVYEELIRRAEIECGLSSSHAFELAYIQASLLLVPPIFLFSKPHRIMHFTAIALTLGLAATLGAVTLGAAVPVDASTDTIAHSDDIIFPRPLQFSADCGRTY
ncbi:hypothetical protein KCU97_g9251, partial [Aureobasidium melanogenum]